MSADFKNLQLNEFYNMWNIKEKIIKVAILVVVGTLGSSCGKKSTKKPIIDPPQRSGTAFVSYSLKYTDQKPALNADGTKLVFISGRDSAEDNSVLKAHKLSWNVGEAPDASAVARVTVTDLGRETFAAISPDGNWVALIIATSTNESAIYVQDFAGAGEPRLITKSQDAITNLTFSPDSALLMWINKSQESVNVKIVGIGTTPSDPISEVAGPVSIKFAANAAWIPGTSYSIAVAESAGEGASAIVINRYKFSGVAEVNNSSPELLVTSELYNKSFGIVANAGSIGFVSKVARSSRILVPRIGKIEEPQPSIPLQNQPQWFVPMASATVQMTAEPFSYDTFALAFGSDNLFTLNRSYYFCEDDTAAAYGSDFVKINTADQSIERMVPRLNAAADGFEMVSGLCDNTDSEGVRRRIDDRMTEIAVSSDSTSASFRMAYVTRISTKFDAACALKLGDPDVYLVERSAEATKIFHLSGNQVALENDARPEGAEPCNL